MVEKNGNKKILFCLSFFVAFAVSHPVTGFFPGCWETGRLGNLLILLRRTQLYG